MPRVFIPPALRSLTNEEEVVDVDGTSIGQAIDALDQRFPGIRDRLCQDGEIRPGLSVTVGDSVAALGMLQRTAPNVEIHFLPAIGGG